MSGRRRILQTAYETIRDAADIAASRTGASFTSSMAQFNPSTHPDQHSTFWVPLRRVNSVKSRDFQIAADAFIKQLEDEGLIGGILPISVTVARAANGYDIEGNDMKLTESKLMWHIADEIVAGFKLAEEAYYEDHSKRPPYTLSVQKEDTQAIILVDLKRPVPVSHDLMKAENRLAQYIHEFLDDHPIKPRLNVRVSVGRAAFHLDLSNLKEELLPNDFALKIAHGMVKQIEAELKRKGAVNNATFEVSQFNNGIPKITAKLRNKQQLTKAVVERAMRDVVAAELPDGNLLRLKAVWGAFGQVNPATNILLAIKPI